MCFVTFVTGGAGDWAGGRAEAGALAEDGEMKWRVNGVVKICFGVERGMAITEVADLPSFAGCFDETFNRLATGSGAGAEADAEGPRPAKMTGIGRGAEAGSVAVAVARARAGAGAEADAEAEARKPVLCRF